MTIPRCKAGMPDESEIAAAQIAPYIRLAHRPHPLRQKALRGVRILSDLAGWLAETIRQNEIDALLVAREVVNSF